MSEIILSVIFLERHGKCNAESVGKFLESKEIKKIDDLTALMISLGKNHFVSSLKTYLVRYVLKNINLFKKIDEKHSPGIRLILKEISTLVCAGVADEETINRIVQDLPWAGVVAMCGLYKKHFKPILHDLVVKYLIDTDFETPKKVSDMSYATRLASKPRVVQPKPLKKIVQPKQRAKNPGWTQVKRKQDGKTHGKKSTPNTFVSILRILGIDKKVEKYNDYGQNPPRNVEPGQILEGMHDLGDGYQRPRLKARLEALHYPFSFNITEKGYQFWEQDPSTYRWYKISFKDAQEKHIEYWNQSTKIMRSSK